MLGSDAVHVDGSLENFEEYVFNVPHVDSLSSMVNFTIGSTRVFSNGAIAFFTTDALPWAIKERPFTMQDKARFIDHIKNISKVSNTLPTFVVFEANEDFVHLTTEDYKEGDPIKTVDRNFIDMSFLLCEMVIGGQAIFRSSESLTSPVFCFCKGKIVALMMPIGIKEKESEEQA